jgi:hypothetical protein
MNSLEPSRLFSLIDLNGYEYLLVVLAGLFIWGMLSYRAKRKERRKQIHLPDQIHQILVKAGEPNIGGFEETSRGLTPFEYENPQKFMMNDPFQYYFDN